METTEARHELFGFVTWANSAGMTKFEAPPLRTLIHAFSSQFNNWLPLGLLSFVGLPSRCPPRAGWKRLRQLSVEVRFRNQFRAVCRLEEFAGFIEVWIYREYEMPGVRWDRVRTIVDVGANVGAATLWFASRAPNARVVAVEPAPELIPTLRTNVKLNRLGHRVTIVPAALGATSGVGYLSRSTSSATTTVERNPVAGGPRVRVCSLSDLLDEVAIQEVDVLKLDCEGAEFEILRSSERSILPVIRSVVGEFHDLQRQPRRDLQEILERSGFACRFVGREDFGLFAASRRDANRRKGLGCTDYARE